MMNRIARIVPTTIGVSGLALASLAAVGGPASAAPTCQLTVDSNQVLNLQDQQGNDEIFFKLGNNRTPTRTYALNQTRNNIGSETFQGSIDVKVFEKDGSNLTLVGAMNNVPCQNNPGQINDVSGAGAIYRVTWHVN
jgi:hypothetical protein